MYGIPAGETFAFIEGRVLEQLCFGRHELILNFDDGLSITVEGALGITMAGAAESIVDDALDIASVLVDLISDTVTAIEVNDPSSFSIGFAQGHIVRLIVSSKRYESFQVRQGDRLIIVSARVGVAIIAEGSLHATRHQGSSGPALTAIT